MKPVGETASDAVQFYAPPRRGPLGYVRVCANDQGVTRIEFADTRDVPERLNAMTRLACRQLAEYFTGKRRDFDLPLAATGTDFQRQVWSALCTIPFGETRSYGQLASELGRANAQRAVGAANGKNPISIVVPCHRVVGSNGQLTGYAWGVERKRWLLEFERANAG